MKVLKKKSWIAVLVLCAIGLLSVAPKGFVLAASSGNTAVTYEKEENASYPLKLIVEGPGGVYDEEEVLRNNKKEYALPIDAIKSFEVRPDRGAAVASIMLNEMEIKNQMIDHIVKIIGKETPQELKIVFKADNKAGVATGIRNPGLSIAFVISLGAAILAYIVWKKWNRRK